MLLQNTLVFIVLCCFFAPIVQSKEEKAKADTAKANNGNGKLGCGLTTAPSTRNASVVRIIPAQEAEKGAWPWMAEIYLARRNGMTPSCGGALLNRFFVLTAAHCVFRRGKQVLDPKDVTVRLGDHDLTSDKDGMKPINCRVESISVHADYDPRTFQNDIALLRLDNAVDFNNHIQPICLPEKENPLTEEDRGIPSGYVAGWGATTLAGPTSDVLLEMSALITKDEVCREAYGAKNVIINDANICSVGVNGSSPCQGFAGAPVVLPGRDNRFHIVGIVSFGYGCGIPEFPDVNARVSKFLDWIGEHVI